MKSRLFIKILAAYVVILSVVITLDSFIVAYQTRQEISAQIKDELARKGQVLLLLPLEQIIRDVHFLSETLKARITIVGADGKVLADSETNPRTLDSHIDRTEIQEARLTGRGSSVRYSQTLRIHMMYVALSLKAGDRIVGYIRLAKPLEEVKTVIGNFYRIVFRAALIILISFFLLSLFFIPKLISPLLKITAYTEKVRGKEVPGSLLVYSRDEIGQLADNINLLVQKYEDNLRLALEERKKLEAAFASMSEGIMILNRENRIELINKGMEDILGDSHDIIGKTPLEVFRNVVLQDNLSLCRETGKALSQEIFIGGDDAKIMHVTMSSVKGLPDEDHKTIMVFHDITMLRKLERTRADFVANVTHEIKTPLTAIIGFIETLQSGAVNDPTQAQRFLRIISEHALRLNRLVDDLLVLSGIELGKVELHLEETPIPDVILKALAVVEGKAREKGLAIRNNFPDDLPPVLADKDSLVQILVNVLDNAVKFTTSGGIDISVSFDKEGYAGIVITDTGIGIPRHEMARIGERFYRVDKMRSRELGGTGLGLSIVKHLLKAQNGWMELESNKAGGTVVKLFLPVYSQLPMTGFKKF